MKIQFTKLSTKQLAALCQRTITVSAEPAYAVVKNNPLLTALETVYNEYDHAGRLLKTKYKINEKPELILVDNSTSDAYDELGRLRKKKRHNGTDSEEFDYNIRNWTTRIKSGAFEEKLFYNTNLPTLATPCYNGNIAYSSWTYNGSRYAYIYKYDDLNRLIKADGYKIIGTSGFSNYGYNELFSYDKHGNILNLQRKKGTTYIDWINPGYNGNQMTFANDYYFSQNQPSVKEYHNFNTSGNDCSYDANGNLIKDLDRNIYTIKYNLLNLPEVIQFKDGHQIINAYDAGGQKLSSRYYTVMIPTEVPLSTLQPGDVLNLQYNMDIIDETGTYYVGNKEYSFNGCDPGVYGLNKVYNAEGYVNNLEAYNGPHYQYYRRDHLGNNREVWQANNNQTIQKTQYYPSGLPWVKNSGDDIEQPINANTRKYNGKEFVEMHGYDTYDIVWRQYYPAIGRFQTPDPEIEQFFEQSPYTMCDNNMVLKTDPDGRVAVVDNIAGAIVGGLADYGSQVIANYAKGSDHPFYQNINLVSIGTSMAVGAMTSGVSAFYKGGATVLASAVNNTVQVKTEGKGVKVELQTNLVNIAKNTAIDLVSDKLVGGLSNKLVGSPLSKVGTTNAGRLNNTGKAFVKATGNNVNRKTTETTKNTIKVVAKGTNVGTETTTKGVTDNKRQELKDKTDQKK